MTDAPLRALIISDGRRGIENQALGLAEAAAKIRPLTLTPCHITHGKAFSALPPALQFAFRRTPDRYGITQERPDIAIGCGRQAIAPLRALKRLYGADIFTVYVQDPRTQHSQFDLIIAPQHDRVSGDNVISMIGSPNRITPQRMSDEAKAFDATLSQYPAPYAAVLIGGPSKRWQVKQRDMAAWHDAMRDLHGKGYSLLITPSRRTPEFARKMLTQFAYEHDRVWLHEDGADNPYFAFLNAAEIILVTEDSTNMLTESCATGKTVFRLPVSGEPGKFKTLFETLETRCIVVRYDKDMRIPPVSPLRETQDVAAKLWPRYDIAKST